MALKLGIPVTEETKYNMLNLALSETADGGDSN
jgi:hypothetical protein